MLLGTERNKSIVIIAGIASFFNVGSKTVSMMMFEGEKYASEVTLDIELLNSVPNCVQRYKRDTNPDVFLSGAPARMLPAQQQGQKATRRASRGAPWIWGAQFFTGLSTKNFHSAELRSAVFRLDRFKQN